jgi:hypothetical protein
MPILTIDDVAEMIIARTLRAGGVAQEKAAMNPDFANAMAPHGEVLAAQRVDKIRRLFGTASLEPRTTGIANSETLSLGDLHRRCAWFEARPLPAFVPAWRSCAAEHLTMRGLGVPHDGSARPPRPELAHTPVRIP